MGPYYRGTSHGIGAFFELFFQHPILMLLFFLAVIGAGFLYWRKNKALQ